MLVTEKNYFKRFVDQYARAKAFGMTWLLSHHNPILSATHRSDLFASVVAADPSLIETLTGYLDTGDLQAATIVVRDAVYSLKAADPFAFDTLSRSDCEALWREGQRYHLLGNGLGNAADNAAFVKSTIDRMDVDAARRWAYETRHQIDAAQAKAAS